MLSVALVKRRGEFTLQVDFAAPTPGIIALFGRSGCGKTTLIDIVAGLLQPDSAQIRLDGVELDMPAEERRIGYVFQDARLFPHYTVAGNLRYGLKRAGQTRIPFDDIVSLLGLAPLLERKPNQLSGGEKQRVALGRALLSQPRLLLLDEPLAALDAPRREEILPYLETLRDRLAIPMIYVSHQLEEVLRLATHIVLLEAGRVTAQGSPGEISLQPSFQKMAGRDAVGVVLDCVVTALDPTRGLAEIAIGTEKLLISVSGAERGSRARVQLLARDLILASRPTTGLSVRNSLRGRIEGLIEEDSYSFLVRVDVGGTLLLARVTASAVDDLGLSSGQDIWVLMKAVSARML